MRADDHPRSASSIAALLLASLIWGVAFSAQRVGMNYVGPFLFNGIRFLLGVLVVLPFYLLRRRTLPQAGRSPIGWRAAALGLAVTGVVLFVAASFQQFGLVFTTAGKAGFITGLYVVAVPLLGLLRGQRIRAAIGAAALLSAGGLYLLTVSGTFTIELGDGLVLVGALFWAVHVHLVGWLAERLRPSAIAVAQFAICGSLSLGISLLVERNSVDGLLSAALPIAYAGLLSVGVAYTLQIVGQRRVDPSRAGIVLSMEAVFGVGGGWLLLHETMTERMLFGCGLMLVAMVLSQWRVGRRAISARVA
jgi:drug/metabolite transporter (DMT)-like permease